MTAEVGSDNVLITNAGSGKNIPGNLPSAGGAGGQNIVAKSARRVRGSSTGTGVLLLLNNTTSAMFNACGLAEVGPRKENEFPNIIMNNVIHTRHESGPTHQSINHRDDQIKSLHIGRFIPFFLPYPARTFFLLSFFQNSTNTTHEEDFLHGWKRARS